ncbi:MAG: hypothetical protein LBM77_10865 [Spirochaetaceae bacterium]|jgi:hypothetical protein|nr:hypothetical protein [Spirochaetaceae bacterium]
MRDRRKYKEIIYAFLNRNYSFTLFHGGEIPVEHTVIFRHDVDFSVEAALDIAKIDKELGVTSTFFFLLNSDFYNIFSRRSYEQIAEIHRLGHCVALHLDKVFYEIPSFAQRSHEIFCSWLTFSQKDIISIHRPGCLTPDNPLKNVMSTYDDRFVKDMRYFSDSGYKWRECPLTSKEFAEGHNIQLLLHPIWWVYDGNTCEQKFEKFLEQRQQILKEELQNNFSEKLAWSN